MIDSGQPHDKAARWRLLEQAFADAMELSD